MRTILLLCSLGTVFSCKTLHKNPSQVKVLERTPSAGIAAVLDKAPVFIENGKSTVVSINRKAGTPPPQSELRLEELFLTMVPADSYTKCQPKLTRASFSELVEKDVQIPGDLQTPAVYRTQELTMTIAGDAERGWTLTQEGGHDIGDLYLTFETPSSLSCLISAVGHGYYAVRGTGSWGEGSGDAERDRLVRAWGSDRGHRLWHYLWHGMRSEWDFLDQEAQSQLIAFYGPSAKPPHRQAQRTPDGEDFLYMHHNMIRAITQYLASHGKTMIPGWKVLPRYGDAAHPSTGSDVQGEPIHPM